MPVSKDGEQGQIARIVGRDGPKEGRQGMASKSIGFNRCELGMRGGVNGHRIRRACELNGIQRVKEGKSDKDDVDGEGSQGLQSQPRMRRAPKASHGLES